VPQVRAAYRAQRDAMRAALERHLGGVARWNTPAGGMFFWVELPAGLDAVALLPRAVEAGMAFVPGAAFYADAPQPRTLRLSFVTVPPERIAAGIEILAGVVKAALS
jgi:2-aminoadipate transaminase